jgi:hypothetical protein
LVVVHVAQWRGPRTSSRTRRLSWALAIGRA